MKNKSRLISVFLCICMLFCICSCTQDIPLTPEESSAVIQNETSITETEIQKAVTDYSDHNFTIHYIDVGQGDAALVVCDDKTMLIDGGKPHAGSIIYLSENLNIDYLDYIVASHADDNHIGGLSAPLAKIKVGNVQTNPTEAEKIISAQNIENCEVFEYIGNANTKKITILIAAQSLR